MSCVHQESRPLSVAEAQRYARTIDASRRIRWDIDRDVIRGRQFDTRQHFLPDGLSLVHELESLTEPQRRFLSQVEGRTYANMFGLVERWVGAKMIGLGMAHSLGNQTAFEAIVRFTDEELKHQELFRRIEVLAARQMPQGYRFDADPDAIASFVLCKSTWAVLALTCHIELFTQTHYKASIGVDAGVSELYQDVFLFHWKEESQHAIIDELEWRRADAMLSAEERDAAVDDLIALVGGVDGLLQAQAAADAAFFLGVTGLRSNVILATAVDQLLLKAYRWQYIVSGALEPRFRQILGSLCNEAQTRKVFDALAPLMVDMPTSVRRSSAGKEVPQPAEALVVV